MKRKFTLFLTALSLLTLIVQPGRAWGQTRDSETASYGWELNDDATQWTISEAIEATSGQGNTGDYAREYDDSEYDGYNKNCRDDGRNDNCFLLRSWRACLFEAYIFRCGKGCPAAFAFYSLAEAGIVNDIFLTAIRTFDFNFH